MTARRGWRTNVLPDHEKTLLPHRLTRCQHKQRAAEGLEIERRDAVRAVRCGWLEALRGDGNYLPQPLVH